MVNITPALSPVNTPEQKWFPIAFRIGASRVHVLFTVAGQKRISDRGTEHIVDLMQAMESTYDVGDEIVMNVPLDAFADIVYYDNAMLSVTGESVFFDQEGRA